MITPEEFARKWDASGLVRPRPEDVSTLNIPEASKRFLVEAGMPEETRTGLRFDVMLQGFPTITEVLKARATEHKRYRLLGTWGEETYICVDEAEDGRVVSMDDTLDDISLDFFNSGIPQMAECLLIYEDFAFFTDDHPTEVKVRRRLKELRKKIARVDPSAMDPDPYIGSIWYVHLDQEENDLLTYILHKRRGENAAEG